MTLADSEFAYSVKKAVLGEYVAQTWGWDEAFQREYHKKDFEPHRSEIIYFDSNPIGWLLIDRKDTHIGLNEIYILPEFQNLGVGSILVEELIQESESKNIPITLGVLKVNRARRFYERHGFKVIDEDNHYYRMKRVPNHSIELNFEPLKRLEAAHLKRSFLK